MLRPSEVAVLNGSGVEKLSHINEVVLSQYQLGETVEINYKAPDGMDVRVGISFHLILTTQKNIH